MAKPSTDPYRLGPAVREAIALASRAADRIEAGDGLGWPDVRRDLEYAAEQLVDIVNRMDEIEEEELD